MLFELHFDPNPLQVSNLIYVDQPIGTGFSYSSDDHDIRHNEMDISNDLYDFIQVGSPFSFSKYEFSYILILNIRCI